MENPIIPLKSSNIAKLIAQNKHAPIYTALAIYMTPHFMSKYITTMHNGGIWTPNRYIKNRMRSIEIKNMK